MNLTKMQIINRKIKTNKQKFDQLIDKKKIKIISINSDFTL